MAKKRKSYGKTTKQWDILYNKYKSKLKGERGLNRLNKTEFKQAWTNRSKGTTVSDLARQTRREDAYIGYEREYARAEARGIQLGAKLSKKAFQQESGEYRNTKDLVESQFFVSRKQAENWMKHAQKLGIEANITDFFKINERHDEFWAAIEALGGWEEAFEY